MIPVYVASVIWMRVCGRIMAFDLRNMQGPADGRDPRASTLGAAGSQARAESYREMKRVPKGVNRLWLFYIGHI